jgi:hypothetical protein
MLVVESNDASASKRKVCRDISTSGRITMDPSCKKRVISLSRIVRITTAYVVKLSCCQFFKRADFTLLFIHVSLRCD